MNSTDVTWTTVIEIQLGKEWRYFSTQGASQHEAQKTDSAYLAECRRLYPDAVLRIANPKRRKI